MKKETRDFRRAIRDHWAPRADLGRVHGIARRKGRRPSELTLDDLGAMDQLHAGLLDGTRWFARWTGLRPGATVLDVGSGLGGPARCFALEFGWQVTALELTRELHEAGRQLTQWLGASDMVTHIVGDFPLEPTSGTWDAIVLLHVDMHLDDKLAAYRRCAGLLRAGGRVLWHDWLAGPGGELLLPVPWADEGEETTALSTPEQFRRDLADAGLGIARFETIETRTIGWFERSRRMITGALSRADGSRRKELRQRLAEVEGILRNLDEKRLVPFVAEARLAR